MRISLKQKAFPIAFSMIVLLLTVMINHQKPHWLIQANGMFYDLLVSKTAVSKPDKPQVVIIDIDDDSVKEIGRWPWPRDKMALLLQRLQEQGVKFTQFDIVFSDPEENVSQILLNTINQHENLKIKYGKKFISMLQEIYPFVDNDMQLAYVLSGYPCILSYVFNYDNPMQKGDIPQPLLNNQHQAIDASRLIVPTFKGYTGIYPIFLENNPYAGFVSNTPDLDAVIRHGNLLGQFNHQLYANAVLSAVMFDLKADSIELDTHPEGKWLYLDGIRVKDHYIPTTPNGQILIPYWGLPGTVDYYSAADVIQGRLPPDTLKGAIAMVGSSMVLFSDLHQSPVFQTFPGVEMNANMLIGILSQQLVKKLDTDSAFYTGIIIVLGIFMMLLLPILNPVLMVVASICSALLVGIVSYIGYLHYHLYFPPAVLLFLLVCLMMLHFLYDFILEWRQKNRIKMLFGQYVPESYVKNIIELSNKVSVEGETRDMTVFFGDIRHFTSLSESLNAMEVKRLLNTFFTPITNIIFAHQGTIDKYVGDMIMAFWGAPLIDLSHRVHALEAVLTIRDNLEQINEGLLANNLPRVNIGMGLASGLMNVGDMGSKFRRSYTVIGDTVNLASRLQELTKFYQMDIIVNEATRNGNDDILWRTIDKIAVKGRAQASMIYQPLCFMSDATEDQKNEILLHEQALSSYFEREWIVALQQFRQLNNDYPDVGLYSIMMKRVEDYIQTPPPVNWEGIFVHTQK